MQTPPHLCKQLTAFTRMLLNSSKTTACSHSIQEPTASQKTHLCTLFMTLNSNQDQNANSHGALTTRNHLHSYIKNKRKDISNTIQAMRKNKKGSQAC